jgi:hypothetical protein
MKPVVFLGDPHLSDRQILTRFDDTAVVCLEKFEWVLDYALGIGADILCTGDVFTHTLYSNKTRHRVKRALRRFGESGGIFASCGGNHSGDVEGTDISTTPYRELGQFCFDGYMRYLGSLEGSFYDYRFEGGGVIVGYSAYEAGVKSRPEDDVVGVVCHHWIQDAFGDSLVVYPDDLKRIFPGLQFVVAGHDHAFHEPYVSRDGVLVVRPGSMMRTDAGKSSRRIPGLAVWYGGDRWEYVPVACARQYDEVFYSEKRKVDAESAGAIYQFVRRMQQSGDVVLDVNSVVQAQYDVVPEPDRGFIRDDLVSNGFSVA